MLFDVISEMVGNASSQNNTNTSSVMTFNQRLGEAKNETTANKDQQKKEKDATPDQESFSTFADLQFKTDPELGNGFESLKEWTGKEKATLVYDSNFDSSSPVTLFEKVRGKPNVAIIVFVKEGDVFGAFYSIALTEKNKEYVDLNAFVFSFKSHGRCRVPQRFMVKEEKEEDTVVGFGDLEDAFYFVFGCSEGGFSVYGDEFITRCNCRDASKVFEGITDTTLLGNDGSSEDNRRRNICTRVVAFAFE